MNKPSEETVIVPKDLYVLNALAAGVALQMLAKLTEETIEDWRRFVASKAGEQYSELSPQEIQAIVDSLEKKIEPPDDGHL
jgi:uncharacterized protein YfkK (UPF0435 family)